MEEYKTPFACMHNRCMLPAEWSFGWGFKFCDRHVTRPMAVLKKDPEPVEILRQNEKKG